MGGKGVQFTPHLSLVVEPVLRAHKPQHVIFAVFNALDSFVIVTITALHFPSAKKLATNPTIVPTPNAMMINANASQIAAAMAERAPRPRKAYARAGSPCFTYRFGPGSPFGLSGPFGSLGPFGPPSPSFA